ncbi:MAG: hypothetical protein EOM24_16895, partial [Chloroflexia bacterium]|nr:hypothetical protein [Chloroflexia bacterium]
AVTEAGVLRCWGHSQYGQYGQAMVPADLGAVSQVSAGWWHTCAMTANGALRCWGLNTNGQTTIPRDPLRIIVRNERVYLPLVQR